MELKRRCFHCGCKTSLSQVDTRVNCPVCGCMWDINDLTYRITNRFTRWVSILDVARIQENLKKWSSR